MRECSLDDIDPQDKKAWRFYDVKLATATNLDARDTDSNSINLGSIQVK